MPRTPRQISDTGYYHVTMRGIGRQLLFEDDGEMRAFLDILIRYRDMFGLQLVAWCLMSNHVHLLVCVEPDVLSDAMKRVALSFAQYHNKRTGHVGHVFQDRFASLPIESDEQLLACVRYIHNNPVKAGLCAIDEYPWSSYTEYAGIARPQCHGNVAETDMVLEMLGGTAGFREFSASEENDCYEPVAAHRMADTAAKRLMKDTLTPEQEQALEDGPKDARDDAIRALKRAGLSVRQIERLTGIGRNTVQRA